VIDCRFPAPPPTFGDTATFGDATFDDTAFGEPSAMDVVDAATGVEAAPPQVEVSPPQLEVQPQLQPELQHQVEVEARRVEWPAAVYSRSMGGAMLPPPQQQQPKMQQQPHQPMQQQVCLI
jgi:hypothetical protein